MSQRLKQLFQQQQEDRDVLTVSEEESSLLFSEAMALKASIEKDFEYIARVEDLTDALEDLKEAAASIESAGYNDLFLIETAVRAAVAGSDLQVDDVMPGLEQYQNTQVSTEALGDTVLKMWQATQKALEKTWKKIDSFFDKVFPSVGRVRKASDKLRDRAEQYADREVQVKSTELGPEINALSVNYKAPKTDKDILDVLDNLQKQCDALFGRQVSVVAKAGQAIAKAVKDFDPARPEDSLESVTNAALELDFKAASNLIGAKTVKDKRFDDRSEVFKGPDLAGNSAIYLVRSAEVSPSALGRAEAARRRTAELKDSSDKERESIKGGTITTISPASALAIRTAILRLCQSIEDYTSGAALESVKSAQQSIREAVSSASSKMKGDDVSQTAVAHYRSAANFASSYARWATSPNTSLISTVLAASRAAITAANKSLSNY